MGNEISVDERINVCLSSQTSIDRQSRDVISVPLNISSSDMIDNIKSKPSSYMYDINNKLTSKNIALIICNSYDNTCHSLGDPAKNDGILTYLHLTNKGYNTLLYHDLHRNEFINIFVEFVSKQQSDKQSVLVYYIGHGTECKDIDGDEQDGYDECLYFRDGTVIDDKLSKIIKRNTSKDSSCKLILITDCCHSGTIFDIPSDYKHVITISASQDSQTAKQDVIEFSKSSNKALVHGVFTYYLWKYIDKIDMMLNSIWSDRDVMMHLLNQLTSILSIYHQTPLISYITTNNSQKQK